MIDVNRKIPEGISQSGIFCGQVPANPSHVRQEKGEIDRILP